jgi:hypothetical protein
MTFLDQPSEKKMLHAQKVLFFVVLGALLFTAAVIGLAWLLDATGVLGLGDNEGSGWIISLIALPALPVIAFCPVAGTVYSVVILFMSKESRASLFPLLATVFFTAITVVEMVYLFLNATGS